MQKTLFALLGLSSSLIAAQNQDHCAPEPGVTCYPDDCKTSYCLGPATILANAPVCPHTCDGDLSITVAGLYWQAHQEGLEYAIDDRVRNNVPFDGADETVSFIQAFNNLIDAQYLSPSFKWNYGFKLGVAYCSPCDGWDVGVNWTWYKGRASSQIEAEQSDNHVLLPLWSAFVWPPGSVNFATDIETSWRLDLNLVDIELGRNFWVSHYLSIRPQVGLRIACIEQNYDIQHKGGNWSAIQGAQVPDFSAQTAQNNEVQLENNFKGVGVRAGLDSTWNLGCGWALYGDFAAAIVYGRFDVDHDEWNRDATQAYAKRKILETDEHFRASRAMLDLGLGIQWMGMVCDCKYGLEIALGWEQHIFFHQNQLWRVNRVGSAPNTFIFARTNAPNNTGENTFHQRRGNLDTQGITLKVKFDF